MTLHRGGLGTAHSHYMGAGGRGWGRGRVVVRGRQLSGGGTGDDDSCTVADIASANSLRPSLGRERKTIFFI